MAERIPEIPLEGRSIRGERRNVTVARGQPGMVAITILLGGSEKPVTVVVSERDLRQVLDRLDGPNR